MFKKKKKENTQTELAGLLGVIALGILAKRRRKEK